MAAPRGRAVGSSQRRRNLSKRFAGFVLVFGISFVATQSVFLPCLTLTNRVAGIGRGRGGGLPTSSSRRNSRNDRRGSNDALLIFTLKQNVLVPVTVAHASLGRPPVVSMAPRGADDVIITIFTDVIVIICA